MTNNELNEGWYSNFDTEKGAKAIIWMSSIISKAAEHILKDGGFHLEMDIDMKSPKSRWAFYIRPKSDNNEPNQE